MQRLMKELSNSTSKKTSIDFTIRPENHLRIVFLAFNYAGEVEIDFRWYDNKSQSIFLKLRE